MTTFITRLDSGGRGPRVAVKDIIDVEGVPTTAGSRALERRAAPAERDAACLAGARSAGARLVGKANLHEFAMLPIGTNPWFGDPNQILNCPAPGGRCNQAVKPGFVIPAPSVNNGLNPLPAQYCYLKPHYLDVQTSYFDHVAKGAL